MQARQQHIERTADRLAVALFLTAIALPAVFAIPRAPREPGDEEPEEEQVEGEQRRAARSPSLPAHVAGLEAYPNAFDRWYSDAFGFRRKLVRWYNLLRWFGLGVTGSSKVVRGEDGWLFYREHRSLEGTLGALPLTPAELEAWCSVLERRRDWCAARGIQYLFVSAPSKAQIYPEYLPHDWKRVGPSRLDQLHEHLALISDVPQLDLRPALLDEKARGDRPDEQDWLYYPLGTHWASRGKVVAYLEIVRALTQGVLAGTPIPRLEDFRRLDGEGIGDSWARRLYLDDFLHQADWQLRSAGPVPDRSPIPRERMAVRFVLPQAPELPRLVLHHDSFAVGVRPLLARHFSRASCYWTTYWQIASLIQERPDVVIDFMVERMLHVERPELLQIKDQARLAALFAAGEEEREIDLLAEDSNFTVVGGLSVQVDEGSLVLQRIPQRRRGWALFDLQELHAPPGSDLVLELDLEAPEATTLEFTYTALGLTLKFKRGQGPLVHLEPGRQIVHVHLVGRRLRSGPSPVVRVGAAQGEPRWAVHAVRVRTIPSVEEVR